MMSVSVPLILLLVCMATALPLSDKGTVPKVDPICMAKHCAGLSVKCTADKNCREAVSCSYGCFEEWDKDTSPQKFTVQNCTNKCVFTYGEEAVFKAYMGCLTDFSCISFPPIPRTCKSPNIKPIKQLTTKDFSGNWWVHRGFHKVYDCYPCQKITFSPINDTNWMYTPEYETYLTNNTLTLVTNQHFVVPNSNPGENITFTYHDVGLDHTETWWPLDKAEDGSWIQMYYCGNTIQWNYEGALVMSRSRDRLNQDAYDKISSSYKQGVGLDLKDFCYTDVSSDCMN